MNRVDVALRVGACGRHLRDQGMAAALVVSPANMFYLTGLGLVPHERLAAVLVGADENLLIVLPDLERDRALEFLQSRQIFAWRDGEDPLATLVAALRVLGVGAGTRLGVEKGRLTMDLADRLRAAIPDLEYVDVDPLFIRMRARKSEEEITCIREACRITLAAMREVFPFIRPGVTELEVATRLDLMLASAGASGTAFRTTVLSGIRSASPHGTSSRKEISRGDVVVIDVGGTYGGYCADVTRTVAVGRGNHRDLEMHELVAAAQQRAIAGARVGIGAAAVDRAARQVIEEAGYGEAFIHRTGHGLGIEVHEPPSLSQGSDEVLEAGMVFTVEPGVYLPAWGGVRIEDVVVLTQAGPQILTESGRELITL